MRTSAYMQPESLKRQRGFSSVEILVGMTVMVLVVAVIGGYYRNNIKAVKRSNSVFVSTQLASSYLEKTKRDLSNPDTLKAILNLVGTTGYTRTKTETLQGKNYDVALKFVKISTTGKLMKVKATVTWDGVRTNSLGTVIPCGAAK